MSNSFFGDSNIPVEPTADMRNAANAMRQLFVSYTAAGFTEQQAMQFVLSMFAESLRGNKEE